MICAHIYVFAEPVMLNMLRKAAKYRRTPRRKRKVDVGNRGDVLSAAMLCRFGTDNAFYLRSPKDFP
jgi:hypothetical protein